MTILLQSGPLALFFAFAICHALADFPLQGDYLARVKTDAAACRFDVVAVTTGDGEPVIEIIRNAFDAS